MMRMSGTVVQAGPCKVAGITTVAPPWMRRRFENSTMAEKEQWWVDFEDMMLDGKKKARVVRRWKECEESREWDGSVVMGRRNIFKDGGW